MRFSARVWQNVRVNIVGRAMLCDMYFSLRFYDFIKGIVGINSVFENLRP